MGQAAQKTLLDGKSSVGPIDKKLNDAIMACMLKAKVWNMYSNATARVLVYKGSTKEELGIVADQYGQPTNAADLAEAIMTIISTPKKIFGIYHFSNYGETTWYDFAAKIAEFSGSSIRLKPLTTAEYPTPAKRPERSTMCLDKIEQDYKITPEYWENSLEECINILQK
ncbi:hypothetical protein FQR65_LT19413 [Abscondita terminalis]|nr:hypothetical protein FQR65_LT19413 [Abscondita terminalis]